METAGFVDGFVGIDVRGWAVSTGSAKPVIIVRDPAGRTIARGTTGKERLDVARLGYDRACGFQVPIRRVKTATRLHVFANGIELVGSPVPFGSGNYDGELKISEGIATGWVSERSDRFTGALVELRDQDGNLLGATEAAGDPAGCDEAVSDPEGGIALVPRARFAKPLAFPAFGRADLNVRAYVGGVRFAEVQASLRLDGYLDLLTGEQAGGWLICPEAPGVALEIEVSRDGVRVGAGRCELPREDVRDRYPGNWRVGFHIRLASPSADAAGESAHVYSFHLAGTEIELFDGPFVVEDRAWAVAVARRIGRWGRRAPGFGEIEQAILQRALAGYLTQRRISTEAPRRVHAPHTATAGDRRRVSIVIPVYRGLEVTRVCIDSVLATRNPATDAVILVNDGSPEPGMDAMLQRAAAEPDVYLLTNAENQGFVRSANRGMAFCRRGDLLLLNSDTRLFPGVIDELCAVAHAAPDIGTVTAMSNNATIFSYPHPDLPRAELGDGSWASIARLARVANRGVAIDVPTGHGFCLLIRREVLARTGYLDEGYGRGYGEENDFCQRAADLGFRNVAAAGAFVEHREGVSFAGERQGLVAENLRRLKGVYPEYHAAVVGFERAEGLRRARWPLDAARLRAASAAGADFVLVATNWLAGGARKAMADIEREAGYGPARRLTLTARPTGLMELEGDDPLIRAVFGPDDCEALFALLASARVNLVLAHQLLGFPPAFAAHFAGWARGRRALYYAHDYFPLCPRVTMIDAAGAFCGMANPEVCVRCVGTAGAHEAARVPFEQVAEHRAQMGALLGALSAVVAPTESAAAYYREAWPGLNVAVAPHPEPGALAAPPRRRAPMPGDSSEILLIGALGPHKGSARLLETARRARLTHPGLRFRVIGYTDIDADLRALSNVVITGGYEPRDLPRLVAESTGWIALFLHLWPETWSYTLTEAVRLGLVPLVPDIGAPAERVRAAKFGHVFPFPVEAAQVLAAIDRALAEGPPVRDATGAFIGHDAGARHRALMGLPELPAVTPILLPDRAAPPRPARRAKPAPAPLPPRDAEPRHAALVPGDD